MNVPSTRVAPNIGRGHITMGQKLQPPSETKTEGLPPKPTWVVSHGPKWKVGVGKNIAQPPLLTAQRQKLHNTAPTTTSERTAAPKTLEERSAVHQPTEKVKFQALHKAAQEKYSLKNRPEITSALKAAGYELNSVLMPRRILPENLVGDLKPLGSGALNQAYTGIFKTPEGKEMEVIIKFEQQYNSRKEMPEFLRGLVQDPNDTRETSRNLAAKTLDNLLGWNNIVHTEIGILRDPKTGVYGVVTAMEKAEGVSGYGYVNGKQTMTDAETLKWYLSNQAMQKRGELTEQDLVAVFSTRWGINSIGDVQEIKDPSGKTTGITVNTYAHTIDPQDSKLIDELTKLQLQDSIMHQGDRHFGNYFIQSEVGSDGKERVIGLKGIDNDQLGGTDPTVHRDWNLKDLPPNISSETCKDIIRLKPRDFQQKMECCLPKAEAKAATARLKIVQKHCKEVLKNNTTHSKNNSQPPFMHNDINSYYMAFLNKNFTKTYESLTQGA